MMPESVSAADVALGTGGAGALFFLLKLFIKHGFGGVLDVKEMGARNDIIKDLRDDIERLKVESREQRDRIETLEGKVAMLKDRLVNVRGHALVAHSIVLAHSPDFPQKQQLIDSIAEIIKED